MKNKKMYFRGIDSNFCESIEGILADAKSEGLNKITVLEACPDNNNPDFIWCLSSGECEERYACKKALCDSYKSKSGRGVCSNRGNLYQHGKEVVFEVK